MTESELRVVSLLAKNVILREAEYPVRRSVSAVSLAPRNTGSPAGACHRAARRADPVAGDDSWGCGAFETVIASEAKQSTMPQREKESMDCFAALAMTTRRAFAISRRDAPEVCIYLRPLGGRGECRVPAAPAAPCAV
jgi:hypothetical protein